MCVLVLVIIVGGVVWHRRESSRAHRDLFKGVSRSSGSVTRHTPVVENPTYDATVTIATTAVAGAAAATGGEPTDGGKHLAAADEAYANVYDHRVAVAAGDAVETPGAYGQLSQHRATAPITADQKYSSLDRTAGVDTGAYHAIGVTAASWMRDLAGGVNVYDQREPALPALPTPVSYAVFQPQLQAAPADADDTQPQRYTLLDRETETASGAATAIAASDGTATDA